ncbi:MAG: alanine dehydrogenase [Pedosphaera sp.]|nr:alanine dehydrogenase [Pedosphaera sp.]
MKEARAIVEAYLRARRDQVQTALATVVCVEGSAYRRPGARMLMREDGEPAGNLSGGCLPRLYWLRDCIAMLKSLPDAICFIIANHRKRH